jgi:radical SAM protein with 4Fe4S-binding SPASM domain
MADNFRIDGHKLVFHVQRVNDWLQGRTVCPIYLEIAPSGGCNYRCIFCAVDYLDYKPKFLDSRVLKTTVKQAAACGVKSIMYAGEGEPLLHQDIAGIVAATKASGIDVAITTNGVLCNKELSCQILKFLSWIRVSLNAGTSTTYEKVHRTKKENFYTVLGNLQEAVRIKKRCKLKTAIGVQLLLIPENVKEVFFLAKILKNIGVDYLTIKPYSQHPLSGSHIDAQFKYDEYLYMNKKLQKIEDEKFKIIFRDHTMKRLRGAKEYAHCFGLPFWAYIDALGDVYACSAFLGKKEFCCGNIYKENFKAIVHGRKRKAILEKARSTLDMRTCRQACRLDKINSYLWELKNPGAHVNFI